MKSLLVLLMVWLAGLMCSPTARAFVDPPTFVPEVPVEGQPIKMFVRVGVCHAFSATVPRGTPASVSVADGIVEIVLDGLSVEDPILCNFQVGTSEWNIGTLPAGTYDVQIRIRHVFPPFAVLPTIAQSRLTVLASATTPQVVPATSLGGLILSGLLVCAVGAWALSRRSAAGLGLLALLAIWPMSESAAQQQPQWLFLELSRSSSAPSPEALVEGRDAATGRALLVGLDAEPPEGISYFVPPPYRARGDFQAYLQANPNVPRARLEQTVVVRYSESSNLGSALTALQADPHVRRVQRVMDMEFSAGTVSPMARTQQRAAAVANSNGLEWINILQLPDAWARAGGWSLVGVIDGGLAVEHLDLRALSPSSALTGGNYLPVYAVDIGRTGLSGYTSAQMVDFNPDEREPPPVLRPVDSECDPLGTGVIRPIVVGHGTHVHGLIAANHSNGDGTLGACKRCGLASARIAYERCNAVANVETTINPVAPWPALTIQVQIGVQVVNMSFGGGFSGIQGYCSLYPSNTECLALALAEENGVLVVAAAGNARTSLNFPARDPRVLSVGGLDEGLDLWNEDKDPPPAHRNGCPDFPHSERECGSNFTQLVGVDAPQALVAPARRVRSTFYPGMEWNAFAQTGCRDDVLGQNGSGQGLCTGTSMSSPMVAGIAGLLRSINPLLPPGQGEFGALQPGIHDVLLQAAVPPVGLDWSARFGYGSPSAGIATSMLLGAVEGQRVRNRLTPVFSLYASAAKDWAYTTVPQAALALMRHQSAGYVPAGPLTPGYAAFPSAAPAPSPPAPRAYFYALTTEFAPLPSQPGLIPLYWLDRKRPLPLGCTPGAAGCNGENRDFLLLTSDAQVQQAVNAGYQYRGLQGYVHRACTPEPVCIPAGAEPLWLGCKGGDDDCAVYLQRDRATFEQQGYSAGLPGSSDRLLGYAYPNLDQDGDGLIDAFERLLGTDPARPDSDGDGIPDGVEYPQAGVPRSDPCSFSRCRPGALFADSFES